MNLSKKTFSYGIMITTIIVGLMVAYFALMLPSLYVDYMERVNYESIKRVQEKMLEGESYDGVQSRNPSATITLKIPESGDTFYFFNSMGNLKITIKDKDIKRAMETVRKYVMELDTLEDLDENNEAIKGLIKTLKDKIKIEGDPIETERFGSNSYKDFDLLKTKGHLVDNETVIVQQDVTDRINFYTNYVAVSIHRGEIILSLLSVVTPQLEEIRPIVFGSLPMIIVSATLIILIATMLFSKKIVNPIEKLANHANYIKEYSNLEVEPVKIEGKDEIAELGMTLNSLYEELNKNFKELEEKNQSLHQQNKKQEVFLRASSHQLKTPIAASLLLVEGMINEVGKYKDTKSYLPKVREKVLEMKNITDSILNLNMSNKELNIDKVDLKGIIDNVVSAYDIQIKEKNIRIKKDYSEKFINTDGELIYKIIDNLIGNGIKYVDKGNWVEISIKDNYLSVINYGSHIEDKLLPHIFDPFVSSSTKEKGHGLGLYIVAFYCELLEIEVEIENIGEGVEARIYWS